MEVLAEMKLHIPTKAFADLMKRFIDSNQIRKKLVLGAVLLEESAVKKMNSSDPIWKTKALGRRGLYQEAVQAPLYMDPYVERKIATTTFLEKAIKNKEISGLQVLLYKY